jgi:single-strand selective monofunctional uracil DNA glycosylase
VTQRAAKAKKKAKPAADDDAPSGPVALPSTLLDPTTPWRAATTALGQAAERLRDALRGSEDLAPHDDVAFILNPLDYAWERHLDYLERHGPPAGRRVEAVLLGMNPGPWGMAQTGVPFGSPDLVKELLGITGPVRRVARTHESRPILGFDGDRTEVSGQRLWGGVRDCFGTADRFFARFFVLNYCPLVLQSETGANVTPDKHAKLLASAFAACDAHLAAALAILLPTTLIGVGAWAAKQGARVIEAHGLDVKVGSILHPSPASPAANRGWLPVVLGQLEALGHPWPAPR